MPSSYDYKASSPGRRAPRGSLGSATRKAPAQSKQPQVVDNNSKTVQRSNTTMNRSLASGHPPRRSDSSIPESRQSSSSATSRHVRSQSQAQRRHRRSHTDTTNSDGGSSVSIQSSPGASTARRSSMRSSGRRTDSPTRTAAHSDGASAPKPVDRITRTRKAIEALNKSLSSEKRMSVISHACAEFDHYDEQKHNAELQLGAAEALSHILSMSEDDDEIRMVCAGLEMVFRSSQPNVRAAFDKVSSNLLPVFMTLVVQCESNSLRHWEVTLLNISRTLYYISRVSELRPTLIRQRGMIDMLKRVASSKISVDCRVSRMRLFANLANCENNKIVMMNNSGMVETLLRIAALDTSEIAREYAAAALMDLASHEANHTRMANMDKLLGTLVKLAVLEQVAETRESAVSALQNLAYSKANRVRLVSYGNGVVLEALKKTVGTDSNDKARRRAAGAITNLVCDETAERMGSHKGLLETLAVASTKDGNADVQLRASMALTKIASSVHVEMACYLTLLDALVVACMSPHAKSGLSSVLRVKARDPANRESMAHHPGILDTILDMCSSSTAVADRHNAMRTIMHLTNEAANVKLLCSKTVLNVLVAGASMGYDKSHEIPQSAITALERLATDFSNRPHMARHDGLLVAVAKATEREAKLEARDDLDRSSPGGGSEQQNTSTNQFLAKPLLMSLLVAM